MAVYQITAPDGNRYQLTGPDGASKEDLINALLAKNPMAGKTTAELEAFKSAPTSLGDIAKSFGAGLIGGGKSLVDVFGAGTGVSKGLGEAQSYLQQALTPERQAEIARRQELENRAAQSGSLFQEAKAFLGGVAEAPLQSLTQAAGSSAPSILAGIAAIPVGAPAALALGVGTIAKLSVGALQGVGEYKGSVFDAVKAEYIRQGRSPVEAERLAEASQQYSREKAFEIGGSAVLGALDAVTGVEPSVGKAMRAASPTGALTKESIEAGFGALRKEPTKAPTRIGQFLKGVAEEAPIEGAQGAFGQYGQNVALQQAGADVTPMEGVLGAGLRDAAVGALFGGAASPLGMKSARQEYATEQFLRQAKAQLDAEKAAAEELQRKEEQRAKTEGELGVPKMLALPAPEAAFKPGIDPLRDPVGRVTEDELGKAIGNNTVVNYLNKYRRDNNLPKLKSYSIEDIKDAMTSVNPEGEEGALNAIIAYKTNYQNQEYTPQDIQNIAVAKNVATDTKGFSDFLTRATGKSDLNTMTQPELHSVATALDNLNRTGKEEQLVLPEGSNASRFTEDQYNTGLTTALGEVKPGKPVSLDQAIKSVQQQTGLATTRDAESLLRTAASNDDITIQRGTGYEAVSPTGVILGTYGTEAQAKAKHRRATINQVQTELVTPRIEEATRPEATLPEGYQIQKETVSAGESPAAYVVREDGSQQNASQTFADEAAAKERLNVLQRKREANAKAEEAAADRVRQDLEKRQAAIAQMEADGKTGTPEHTKAVYAFKAAEVAGSAKITEHLDKAEAFRTPLKIVPLGKKTSRKEKHTVTKDGKVVASFDTNDKAQAHVLSLLDDKALESIAERGGVMGKRASVELDMRQRPGVRGGTTEGLEKAGVHTPKVEAQLKELEAKLIPMLKKFGLEQVGLNVVRAIENDADGAWGRADKLIRIALQATNPIKTMRHEALHALKELGFFTDAQWEALKRQADKVWVDKYLKSVPYNETMSRYDAYANGLYDADGNMLMAPLSYDEILEEAIADAFGDWEGGAKPPPGMMAALFKRLQQFFSALRQALTGAGFESAEDIFGKIERGELRAGKEAGGAESKASVKNTTKGMLNPNIAPKYEKILEDVIKEMGLTPEEFASTSLIHQTGKAGTEQFETEKVGGLPEVIQFLQDERRKSGLPLLDIENADDRKIVAKLMATEAMAAIRSGGANLEWYDSVINKTLAMAGLKYSELNTDINARAAFRIATAITSQGLNVEDNLGFAMKVYDQFRQTGKFPEIGQGADQAAMINNFKLANYLMDDMGANLLRQFLETEFTVEELRSAGFNIAGELGDEKVLGSSVFGPKIGFGFYSNLNGNFEPVTMDMWFMRTIGRLTGKLKAFRQDLYDAQLKKFRDELDTQGSNGVFANQFDQNEIDLAKADDTAAEALARKVKSAHERDFKANRAAYDDGSRAKSKLVAASETMIKSLDSPKDAPANGSERRNLRDIVRQMVDIVEEKYGKRVPPASLQAVIWYPEQELYKALGVKLRVTSQNYAGAIEKILLGEGYGKSDLESAAKLGSRTAQQVARAAVSKAAKTTGTKPVRLGSLEAEEKESLLERGRKRVVLEQEKEAPRRKRVIFEVAPDPNNKALTEKWRSLPNNTRIEISNRIGNTIIKKALEQFGLTGYVDTQVGSYLDDTNPSFALYLDSGDAVNMAKFLGFVLSQDSMMIVSPKEGKGLDETGAVRINLGDVDAAKVDDIYQKLREIEVDGEKPVGGQSFMNGHMVVLNYSNVPTSQLATLINDKLNDNYEVITENVYTAFPEKKDYDYANPSSDPRGNAGVLRQAGRDLRSEATRLLQKELKTIKPKAAPADQKLSLRQVKEIFGRAESIPEPPGVESIRRQWIGGVSGIGDRDPMYDLYRVNGSKKYIQDVQDFLRKELGDDFKGYRLMSNDELEELQTGAMGSQYASFTLNPDIARAFKNIPAYADKTGMSVVEMDLTPEHVAMIGHPGELELVVDYGQGYNPSEIKVVEKYSLRIPETKGFKQWVGKNPIIPASDTSQYKGGSAVFQAFHGTTYSNITVFDPERGSQLGALGAGPYFSTSAKDASANYAGIGPDLKLRIELLADQLEEDFIYYFDENRERLQEYFDDNNIKVDANDLDPKAPKFEDNSPNKYFKDASKYLATKQLKGDSEGLVMPVFIKLEKPFDMTSKNIEFMYDPDAEGSEVDDWSRLIEGINDLADQMQVTADEAISAIQDNADGMTAKELRDIINNNIALYHDPYTGEPSSSNQFLQYLLKELGYDGIIQNASDEYSTMIGVERSRDPNANRTFHIMPFTPQQVKSATGNKGTFDPTNKDIRYSLRTSFSTAEAAEKAAYKKAPPDTPEFKRFFGASKVKEEGRPQVMYHGSQDIFEEFMDDRPIFVTPDAGFAEDFATRRIRSQGKKTKPQIYPLWVRAETPFDYENKAHVQQVVDKATELYTTPEQANRIGLFGGQGYAKPSELFDRLTIGQWDYIENGRIQEILKQLGFDSFFVREGNAKNLAVFNANQVKSVTGNIGGFGENKDIRFSLKRFDREDLPTNNKPFTLPENTMLFHGSHETRAKEIEAAGRVLVPNYPIKSSGGGLDEGGLIFFGDERTAKNFANSEADPFSVQAAIKAGEVRNPGVVFETVTDRPYRLISRYHKLTKAEAQKLNRDLGIPDYKRLQGGDSVDIAASRGLTNSRVIERYKTNRGEMASVWPAIFRSLGFDGFYDNQNVPAVAMTADNGIKLIGDDGRMVKYSLPTFTQATQRRVDETTIVRENKGVISRILESFAPESLSELRAAFIHRYDRLGFYDKKLAEKMGGKVLLADVSAEAAANMSDLSSSITASVFGIGNRKGGIPVYRNGFTTVDNSVKGAIEILRPLAQFGDPSAYQHYQFWAGVKRGSRFMAETSPTGVVSYREKNFEPADIAEAEVIRKGYLAKGVDFNVIQKEMNTFNDGLVNYMIATGVISKEKGEAFKKHMDYIPFFRQIDGEQTVGPKIYNAISGVKPPKKLKGGEAPLTDYLESIVRNAQAAINAGMKNVAAQKAVNVAMQLGPQAGAQRLNVIDNAPDTVQVLENGKQVSYRVADPLFINAVKSLNMAEMPFLGMLSAPANLLRNLVTKDPGFMLANLARDSLSAWVTSGVNVTPIIGTASNFAKALAGNSPTLTALLNGGILGGYEFSSGLLNSANTLERDLNKKYSEKGSALPLKTFTGIWDALEKGTEASDAATRMAVYDRVLEETGNEAEALYRALEVMNFNRKGNSPVVRILTAAIPFLNARIQGLDVLYRTAFGRNVMENAEAAQKAFFVRGATLMALSAAYFLAVSDDDEWKKQEQETKDNYWIAPGIGKFPTPFEVGFLFKTVPERLLAYTMKDDTGQDLMDSMRRGLLNTFAFNPIPQVAKPLVEYSANYNFFTGRPIVGMGMEGKEPEYQVGPSTTKTAEMIGKSLGLSPLKIDQLISGYTGTMGSYLMLTIDSVLDSQSNSPNASKRFEQLPVIKRFAADPEARGNITQYYELKRAVDAAVETQNYLLKAGKPEEYADFVEKNAGLLAVKSYVSNMEKSMKQLRDMRKVVQGAEMTADEKRDTITAIGQAENNMTQNIQTIKKLVSEYQ